MKRKKKTKAQKLQTKCENLWKEIAFLRDGHFCQVQSCFPNLNISHSDIMQVDHFIERGWKRTFVDVRNSTVVCRNCNMNKRFNSAIRSSIEKIRRDREGDRVIDEMLEIRGRGTPFIEWRQIGWLEDKVLELTQIRDLYKERII